MMDKHPCTILFPALLPYSTSALGPCPVSASGSSSFPNVFRPRFSVNESSYNVFSSFLSVYFRESNFFRGLELRRLNCRNSPIIASQRSRQRLTASLSRAVAAFTQNLLSSPVKSRMAPKYLSTRGSVHKCGSLHKSLWHVLLYNLVTQRSSVSQRGSSDLRTSLPSLRNTRKAMASPYSSMEAEYEPMRRKGLSVIIGKSSFAITSTSLSWASALALSLRCRE
mmetsp:Transcript_14482/g.39215  ORF Transcript_14482/g.39215 Transcript_14482/m.39215 type:complete len:224 (-) Transcript_14482:241-912(-)